MMCLHPGTSYKGIMNWMLVIVLVIIILNALTGLKVGLTKILFSLFSFIIAMAISVWISPVVNNMLKNNEKFYEKTKQKMEAILFEGLENTDGIDELIGELPLPKSIKESLIKNKSQKETNAKSYIAAHVTDIALKAMSFIISFVVVFIGLWVISIALNIISKLPILNQINKLAGLLVGGLQGLVVVWIIFTIVTMFSGTELGSTAFKQIESSSILSFLYDKNILTNVVLKAVKGL
ncbi:MAG: hypothetical protein GX059_04210 [Clostridiales bacterium]|nr:hypothetical protein [Clostridiales bacterium]